MSDADARWPSHEELGTFDEEQRCVALIRGGDEAAFKALYDRYSDAMFAFAHSSLESRAEAEDVVRDVFLAILRQRSSDEGPRHDAAGPRRIQLTPRAVMAP
jgi:hypothetical protein